MLDKVRAWAKSAFRVEEVEQSLERMSEGLPEFDPWGFSPKESVYFANFAYWMYRYFRPVVSGIENLPEGRCLIVPNHSGQLPFDGMVVGMSCFLEAQPPRLPRAMVERWVPTLPFINVMFSRAGAVVGDPINCRNLLEEDNAILVFPEGARGSGKTWDRRYQLEKFGRGFMRLALQTNTPVIPVAVVGAEESIISLYDLKPVAKALGMPYFPITPLFPLLGPLSMFPMPTRFYVHFGEPMHFEGPFDDEDEVIDEKVAQVRNRVQEMIDKGLLERPSIF